CSSLASHSTLLLILFLYTSIYIIYSLSLHDALPIFQYDIGMIATGDSFMDDSKRVSFVRKQFPNVIAVEMEAAAIAQVCYQYGTPFVIIRALSDIAGKEATVSFDSFLKQAAKNASDIVRQMVKDI